MIFSREDIICYTESLRQQRNRIVFTNGCFDILHRGHIHLLTQAKTAGDVLIVGLNSDDSVRRLKGHGRPINPQEDRAVVLDALRAVDAVTIFEEDTPLELITALLPDVLVKGGDYSEETVVGADIVRQHGGKIVIVPLLADRSTSRIVAALAFGGQKSNPDRTEH